MVPYIPIPKLVPQEFFRISKKEKTSKKKVMLDEYTRCHHLIKISLGYFILVLNLKQNF